MAAWCLLCRSWLASGHGCDGHGERDGASTTTCFGHCSAAASAISWERSPSGASSRTSTALPFLRCSLCRPTWPDCNSAATLAPLPRCRPSSGSRLPRLDDARGEPVDLSTPALLRARASANAMISARRLFSKNRSVYEKTWVVDNYARRTTGLTPQEVHCIDLLPSSMRDRIL